MSEGGCERGTSDEAWRGVVLRRKEGNVGGLSFGVELEVWLLWKLFATRREWPSPDVGFNNHT